jgi:formyl-CoA transferase
MMQFQMSGEVPPPFPSRVSAWSVYDTFALAGNEQLFIGAVSDKQFEALCRLIGREDLLADPELATNAQRVERRPALLQTLGETLATVQAEALVPRLEAAGVPYAPVVRPDQLVEDPHLLASGGLVDMDNDDGSTSKVVLLPLTLGGRRPGVRMPLPAVGEHTAQVLADLPR